MSQHVQRRTRLASLAALGLALASCVTDPNEVTAVEEAVCAAGATTEGVDVSTYQGTAVNWASVHSSGRQFAITRINNGTNSLDNTFTRNWAGIRTAGMIRGGYQYFRPGQDAMAQATIVCNALGRLGSGDLPAMLDIEQNDGVGAATIISRMHTWLDAVERCTGKRPMIYTAGWFWNPNVGSTAFGTYPLVVAAYGPSCPTLPMGWSNWIIFQYSDGTTPSGLPAVPGIGQSCDRDKFNGNLAALQNFAGMSPTWGAQFVSQSFPYAADGTLQVHQGETVTASITMRNIGTHAWDGNTRLATTQPRDRMSQFADASWVSPSRLASVTGSVAQGATFRFDFTVHAPATLAPGRYPEYFGMVEEGVSWFSAPGEGGPADNQLQAIVEVLPALAGTDAGPGTDAATDDAATTDASTGDAAIADASDASSSARDANANDAGPDGGTLVHMGGCGCRVPSKRSSSREGIALGASAIAAFFARRRRRTPAA